MNKKTKDLLKYRNLKIHQDADDNGNILKDLQYAWNSLPEDLYDDERMFFLDLVEQLAKAHSRVKIKTDLDDMSKN